MDDVSTGAFANAVDRRSVGPTNEFLRSAQIYLCLMASIVAVRVIITFWIPTIFKNRGLEGIFSWPFIVGMTVLGLPAIWLCGKTGIPAMWDKAVSTWWRIWLPLLLGVALGGVAVLSDVTLHHTKILEAITGQRSINIAFPSSVLIYPTAAIAVNVIFYLLPIPLLVWLVSNLLLKGRAQASVYWVVAALAASVEPMGQLSLLRGHFALITVWVFAYLVVQELGFNLAEVYFFRRAGFLATVALRVGHYLVWHILWGLTGA